MSSRRCTVRTANDGRGRLVCVAPSIAVFAALWSSLAVSASWIRVSKCRTINSVENDDNLARTRPAWDDKPRSQTYAIALELRLVHNIFILCRRLFGSCVTAGLAVAGSASDDRPEKGHAFQLRLDRQANSDCLNGRIEHGALERLGYRILGDALGAAGRRGVSSCVREGSKGTLASRWLS